MNYDIIVALTTDSTVIRSTAFARHGIMQRLTFLADNIMVNCYLMLAVVEEIRCLNR